MIIDSGSSQDFRREGREYVEQGQEAGPRLLGDSSIRSWYWNEYEAWDWNASKAILRVANWIICNNCGQDLVDGGYWSSNVGLHRYKIFVKWEEFAN